MIRWIALGFLLLIAAAPARHSRYLYAWAMEVRDPSASSPAAMGAERDMLAVFDVSPDAARFGRLVAALPVGNGAKMAHHTNYSLPPNDELFANDWLAGRTYIFNLADPRKPRLAAQFGDAAGLMNPHSFVALSNGRTLATFQYAGGFNRAPGGLAELDDRGRVVRTSSAADPAIDPNIRPYSMAVVEKLDRVVTGSADMLGAQRSDVVQIWRLSDLKLLKTLKLPKPHYWARAVAVNASEPRVLGDGTTVLVPTFGCGLYRVVDLAGDNPSLQFIYDFGYRVCEVPLVVGKYWVETMESGHAIVSLDVSDASHPREVSRALLPADQYPHWIAREPGGDRLVITGYGALKTYARFATIDRDTGQLTLSPQSIDFTRAWPDGWNGSAVPHGAVFSR